MSHEEFFEKYGSNDLQHVGYHGGPILVEALYQAFKARLIAELLVDVHNCPVYGRLVPKDES